ncbi:hypothetical protein, partial [Flavobacterium branchiophilum]|uniref:hypothetical protein n=1 Tax=Flavobacterium branchiophilum TaxID=55197 RepID=UPI001A9C4F89
VDETTKAIHFPLSSIFFPLSSFFYLLFSFLYLLSSCLFFLFKNHGLHRLWLRYSPDSSGILFVFSLKTKR